jgi:mono/diheme cytochrome c family protein
VRPETGRLVWHYQTTPGEHWDYTAVQQMILADLTIEGRLRKVLMQAPKNGFFYLLDRETGELLSAEKFVHVSWATHVDLATGRPVERPEAVWEERSAMVAPNPEGGHSWHPMSYSRQTGLVYIPAMDFPYQFTPDPDFRYRKGQLNLSEDWGALTAQFEGYEMLGNVACSPTRLLAWDPVKQRKVWEVRHDTGMPGGVVSTAGGLVFQGSGTGEFVAYDAHTGKRLWASAVGIGIMAGPITYRVDGEQYVAVLAGAGGDAGTHLVSLDYVNEGRLLAFKLGGQAPLPPVKPRVRRAVEARRIDVPDGFVSRGRDLYAHHCALCHGFGAIGSGLHPDLRLASREVHESWNDIVLGGVRMAGGMASFADILSSDDARAIHAYVIERALHEPTFAQRAAQWFVDVGGCIPGNWLTD